MIVSLEIDRHMCILLFRVAIVAIMSYSYAYIMNIFEYKECDECRSICCMERDRFFKSVIFGNSICIFLTMMAYMIYNCTFTDYRDHFSDNLLYSFICSMILEIFLTFAYDIVSQSRNTNFKVLIKSIHFVSQVIDDAAEAKTEEKKVEDDKDDNRIYDGICGGKEKCPYGDIGSRCIICPSLICKSKDVEENRYQYEERLQQIQQPQPQQRKKRFRRTKKEMMEYRSIIAKAKEEKLPSRYSAKKKDMEKQPATIDVDRVVELIKQKEIEASPILPYDHDHVSSVYDNAHANRAPTNFFSTSKIEYDENGRVKDESIDNYIKSYGVHSGSGGTMHTTAVDIIDGDIDGGSADD